MKNNTLTNIFIFAAGSAVGSLATWKFVENKYKAIADAEIKEVKEFYRGKKYEGPHEPQEEVEVDEEDDGPTVDDYVQFVKNETNYSGGIDISEKGEPVTMVRPYVIPPEEFNESDYDTVSLSYYADGILTNEEGDIVEDIESLVGLESLDHFGEYEEDSVFVRDDRLEIDYEILRQETNYYNVQPSIESVEE